VGPVLIGTAFWQCTPWAEGGLRWARALTCKRCLPLHERVINGGRSIRRASSQTPSAAPHLEGLRCRGGEVGALSTGTSGGSRALCPCSAADCCSAAAWSAADAGSAAEPGRLLAGTPALAAGTWEHFQIWLKLVRGTFYPCHVHEQ